MILLGTFQYTFRVTIRSLNISNNFVLLGNGTLEEKAYRTSMITKILKNEKHFLKRTWRSRYTYTGNAYLVPNVSETLNHFQIRFLIDTYLLTLYSLLSMKFNYITVTYLCLLYKFGKKNMANY